MIKICSLSKRIQSYNSSTPKVGFFLQIFTESYVNMTWCGMCKLNLIVLILFRDINFISYFSDLVWFWNVDRHRKSLVIFGLICVLEWCRVFYSTWMIFPLPANIFILLKSKFFFFVYQWPDAFGIRIIIGQAEFSGSWIRTSFRFVGWFTLRWNEMTSNFGAMMCFTWYN